MSDEINIFYHSGGSWEGWLDIDSAGRLIYHRENDGYRYLRRGAEGTDEELTLEQAVNRFPLHKSEIEAAVKRAK